MAPVVRVGAVPDDVIGPRLGVGPALSPKLLKLVGMVHVLVDVVPSYEYLRHFGHGRDLSRRAAAAPEKAIDPRRNEVGDDGELVLLPAPHIRCAEETVDERALFRLLGKRLQLADLLRVGAVALAHRDIPTLVEEHIANAPLIAEVFLLVVPARAERPQLSLGVAPRNHRRIVRRLDDRHPARARSVVLHAEKRHADAVSAVGDEAPGNLVRFVCRIAYALVHRNDEPITLLRSERGGIWERRLHLPFARDSDRNFRTVLLGAVRRKPASLLLGLC